jgi:translocator protein
MQNLKAGGNDMGRFMVNLLVTLLVVVVNALANSLPINGQTSADVSNKLDVLFTPAGYVFGIWGLIYFLLFIWVLRQFPQSRRDLPMYKKATPLYVLSSILNISWLLLWHYEFFLFTVIVMLCLLVTLIALYKTIKDEDPTFWDMAPFSIYLGWVSVATIANISYYLKYVNWDGFGLSDVTWTFIMLVIGSILAILFSIKNNDVLYPLVFTWAFIGIGVKNTGSYPALAFTAYALAAIVAISALILKKMRKA